MAFIAGPVPQVRDLSEALSLIWDLFQALEAESGVLVVPELHAEPKAIEGLVVYADGTDWDPGAGVGLYRFGGGVWVKI